MNFRKPGAIYRQIADQLLDNILAGELKAGDRLLSVREMAAHVEVNPNTVVRTYNYLQDKGVIYNERGIGYFVADEGLRKTTDLRRKEFFVHFLPEVFRSMELLDISMDDMKKQYEEFRTANNSES